MTGEPTRVYETRQAAGIRRPLGIFLALGGIGALVLGVGWGGMLGLAMVIDPPPGEIVAVVAGMALIGPIVGVVGAVALFGLGVFLYRGAKDRSLRLEEHEDGIVLVVDDERAEVPWSEAYFYRPPTQMNLFGVVGVKGPYPFFAVSDGTLRVDVRGLADLRDWGDAIEDKVVEARLPLAQKAIEDGENVRFGSVFVTPQGISGFGLLNDTVTWDRLKGFGIGRHNFLVVREKSVPVAQKGPLFIEVPNAKVLFALVHHHRQDR